MATGIAICQEPESSCKDLHLILREPRKVAVDVKHVTNPAVAGVKNVLMLAERAANKLHEKKEHACPFRTTILIED